MDGLQCKLGRAGILVCGVFTKCGGNPQGTETQPVCGAGRELSGSLLDSTLSTRWREEVSIRQPLRLLPCGSRIIFTTHINVHPPGFLNAKTMFDLSWTKQIDWIKALKDRAREVLKSNETFRAAQTPVLPKWLWQDPTEPTKGSVRFSFPHEMMIAPSKLYQRTEPFWSFPPTSPVLFVALAAAVSVLIFVAMRAHRALALIKETSDSRELLARRGHTSDMEHLFSRRFTSAETDLVEPGI